MTMQWIAQKALWIRIAVGAVGVSSALFAAGFLVDRGHITLFGVPSGMLASTAERTVYLGGHWVCGSLVTVFAHWSAAIPLTLALIGALLADHTKLRLWLGLVLFVGTAAAAAGSAALSFDILTTRSDLMYSKGPSQAASLLESDARGGERLMLYRLISWLNFALALALPVAVRSRCGSSRAALRAVFTTALLLVSTLGAAALLAWPMCYGRLVLGYERPLLRTAPEAPPVVVLNPYASVWTTARRDGDRGVVLSMIDPTETKTIYVGAERNAFRFLRGQPPPKAPMKLPGLMRLLYGEPVVGFLRQSHLGPPAADAGELGLFVYELDSKQARAIPLPDTTTSALLLRGQNRVFALVDGRLRAFDLAVEGAARRVKLPPSDLDDLQTLVGFTDANDALIALRRNREVLRIEFDGSAFVEFGTADEEVRFLASQHLSRSGQLAIAQSKTAGESRLLVHDHGKKTAIASRKASADLPAEIREPRWSEDGGAIVFLARGGE